MVLGAKAQIFSWVLTFSNTKHPGPLGPGTQAGSFGGARGKAECKLGSGAKLNSLVDDACAIGRVRELLVSIGFFEPGAVVRVALGGQASIRLDPGPMR